MGGGDLNLKKSWHPHTLKNQERVWKAEQAKAQEEHKLRDLRKEIDEERNREELRAAGENSGVLKTSKNEKQMEWMYKNNAEMINHDEYLLGRTVDKNFEKLQNEEERKEKEKFGIKQPINHVEHECVPFSMRAHRDMKNSEQVDVQRKTLEDPLMQIKKLEMEKRRKLLDNPVKLKKLRELLETKRLNEKNKRRKKSKLSKLKKSKKSRKHSVNTEGTSSSSGTDSETDSSSTSSSSNSDAHITAKLKKLMQKMKRTQNADIIKKLVHEIKDDHKSKKRHKTHVKVSNKSRSHRLKSPGSVSGESIAKSPKKYIRGRNKSITPTQTPIQQNRKRYTRSRSRSRSRSNKNPFAERRNRYEFENAQHQRAAKNPFAKDKHEPPHHDSRTRNNPFVNNNRDSYTERKSNYSRKSPENSVRSSMQTHSRQSPTNMRRQSPNNARKPRQSSQSQFPSHGRYRERSREQKSPYARRKRSRSRSRSNYSPHPRVSPIPKHSRTQRSRSRSYSPKHGRNEPRRSEPDKAARLREMMENAEWRETDRMRAVTKHRKDNEREDAEHKTRDFDKNFINKQVSRALSNQTSVGSRLRANLNNIQRSSTAMDTNFARK